MAYTPEQERAIRLATARMEGSPQRTRMMAQGATLGFADEIEAAVRSMVPGGPEYSEIRNEIRDKLSVYKEQNPGAAITYEVIGALAPSLLMMASGVGAPTGVANLSRAAGVGALEGGLYAYGSSEDSDKALRETGIGIVTGAIVNPAVQSGLRAGGGLFSKLISYVREKIGQKPATAVQAELQRLQEQTGKSTEEIVSDLMEGRLMSDNKTLMIALKNMVSEGGESGREVLSRTQARAGETRQQAMEGLREQLAPEMDPNVMRSMRQSEEQIKEAERQAYKGVYQSSPEVTPAVADEMLRVAKADPDVAQNIVKIYRAEGKLVPPFKIADNGEIQLVRVPSLKDAETMRQLIDDKARTMFKNGDNTMGIIFSGVARTLREQIDSMSPQLARTRQTASQTRTARDAFEAGRKAMSMNVDELELLMESFTPEAARTFRAGLMDAIRNKVRRQGTTLANLADEDKQFGQVLRVVLGDQDVSQLSRQLQVAGETAEIAQRMPPTAGSPTAPLTQERARSGMRGSFQDVSRVAAGDPTIIIDVLDRVLRRDRPQLTDQQRMQVVNVLFSRDPEFVRKALTGEAPMDAVIARINQVADALATGAGTASVQQSTQATTGLLPAIEEQR
jgi:hypothetical protein